jgi:uncharacterized cupin superfamily protein
MSDTPYVSMAIEDLPQLWGGVGKLVREGLGISAFGVQILDFAPGHVTRSHDEADSGQEELYVALRGSGELEVAGGEQRLPLDADHVARVSAGCERLIRCGPEGLRVLCVGGVPGRPYEPPAWTTGADAD